MTPTTNRSASSFGQEHFATAQLGDQRRTARLVQIADRLSRHPGGTLPQKLASPKDYKALMRLVNGPQVTHASVLASHYERTRQRMEAVPGVVLLIHDTTELDYSGLKSITTLGQIGNARAEAICATTAWPSSRSSGKCLAWRSRFCTIGRKS